MQVDQREAAPHRPHSQNGERHGHSTQPRTRRGTDGEARYSVVEAGGTRHLHLSISPRGQGAVPQQLAKALEIVKRQVGRLAKSSHLVQLCVFVAQPDQLDICPGIVAQHFGSELPAASYVPQPPADGSAVAVEAWAIGADRIPPRVRHISKHVVEVHAHEHRWVYCANVAPATLSQNVYDRSLEAFEIMRHHLHRAGVEFDHAVRTWLYLGDIVGDEGDTQRYKELNRARTDYYSCISFPFGQPGVDVVRHAYPASTGIGTEGREILMGSIALAADRGEIRAVPLENPRQVAASDYAVRYSPQSPKFCRAIAIACRDITAIYISGTASITQSETQHVGDVAAQTHETLTNIEALISEDNLASHGLAGAGATREDLASVRVYIKYPHDYPAVRQVCEQRLGGVPAVYTIADVCRPDLLVEIEGVAFSRPCQ